MRIYKMFGHICGEDATSLEVTFGFMVAENDEVVYDRMNKDLNDDEWPENFGKTREAIIAAKGDYDPNFKYEDNDGWMGWEDLGEISAEDIAHLKRLKILAAE